MKIERATPAPGFDTRKRRWIELDSTAQRRLRTIDAAGPFARPLTMVCASRIIQRMSGELLQGVRILEVAMFAPDGAGMHLADLGAEVIKIETPGLGDPARLLGKPYRGEAPATRRWNRGKRSLCLDLRRPEGAAVFRELVGRADAVIEGMRPGALERRGLGYEALRAHRPGLVFMSLSGWGESGPYRDLAAHGLAFDAFAGLAPPRVVDASTPCSPRSTPPPRPPLSASRSLPRRPSRRSRSPW